MFLDEVTITAQGGDGGRGSVSWRREKYVPKGGPDGGDGGRGGDVSLIADGNTDTLSAFASQKCFTAGDGTMGGGKKCHGRDGKNFVLKVPPGTLVYEQKESGRIPSPGGGGLGRGDPITTSRRYGHPHLEQSNPLPLAPSRLEGEYSLLADLAHAGDSITIAHGGRGGYGNAHFVSSIRQRPDFAELGEPGEERQCRLELKLIADIGIIGLPNCGKSTLIAAMSAARPRIADYPFTTLVPNLGVVILKEQPTFAQPPHELRPAGKAAGKSYIVCDIPGLIEGASTGKGLGDRFLRHIERCGILLHLLDCTRTDTLVEDYHVVRKELAAYSPTLAGKKELVVLNKTDLIPGRGERERIENRLQKEGIPVSASISAALHTGTEELKERLLPLVLSERQQQRNTTNYELRTTNSSVPILRPHETSPRASAYQIHQEGTTVYIRGKRIEQIATMTNTKNASATRRLLHILDRIGLIAALRSLKLSPEHQIFIGKTRIDPLLSEIISGETPRNH